MNLLIVWQRAPGWLSMMVVIGGALPARATEFVWQSPLGGSFTTSDLWQPFDPDPPGLSYGPGGAGDTVNFNLGVAPDSRYVVTDVAGSSRRLLVHSDALTLNISDAYRLFGSSSTDPNLVVGVAAGQTGDLILTGNGLLQTWHGKVSIGHAAGSSGVVTVDGLQWMGDRDLTVGNAGSGKLTIQNGGTISYIDGIVGAGPGATGEMTVTGEGSAWTDGGIFSIGLEGIGAMTISEGGQVSNYISMIGFMSGSSGSSTVSGEGSMWVNYGNLIVGESGHGTLTVEGGGSVSTGDGTIGRSASSTGDVIVTGADTTWINRGILSVGSLGAGMLTIQEGGLVSTSEGFIGNSAGSTGEVTVTGAGSTWVINNPSLIVGRSGTGALTIEDGGRVASAVTTIGCFAGSTGEVTITGIGSTWTNDRLYIGGDRFEPGTGTTSAV